MAHLFRTNHVVSTQKINMNGGTIIQHHKYINGRLVKVKEKRDPRTNKIYHVPEEGGYIRSIVDPPVQKRPRRNRFTLSDVPGALSHALSGGAAISMF